MENDSDPMLPYFGLEEFADHPEPLESSGRETFTSSPPESPATKASTSQPKEISREQSCHAVPMENPLLEPDDLRHEIMHIEQRLSMKPHRRVGCLLLYIFTPLIHYAPRCQMCTGNQPPWSLLVGVLVFKALEVLSTNTLDYIPMAPHK
jgi:hypothetical protein